MAIPTAWKLTAMTRFLVVSRLRTHRLANCTRAEWCRLMALAVMAALASTAQGTVVSVHAEPLEVKIREAGHVYHVAISSIDEHFFTEDGAKQLCGTNYSVEIIETLKGVSREQLIFSVYTSPLPFTTEPLQPGDELVILIADKRDAAVSVGDSVAVIESAAGNTSKSECLRQLSPIRPTRTNESAFLLERGTSGSELPEGLWFRYMKSRSAMPVALELENRPQSEDCLTSTCDKTGFYVVRWAALRKIIRSWSGTCDQ